MNRVTKAVRTVGSRLKALMVHRVSGTWSALLLRTHYDYAGQIGDGTKSSIVMACVNWGARTFPEAPVQVIETDADGQSKPILPHPLAQLIERPNPYYSGPLLWMATYTEWTVSGNAYWLKVRNGQGRPLELWWIPQSLIEPKWPFDGSEFISHYEYHPDGRTIRLDVADVVHFRYGLDPQNPRKGLSPLASLFREIFTDEEAANFTAALLKNMGIPGVIISPDTDMLDISPAEQQSIKEDYMSKFAGDKRGEPLILSGKVKVTPLSFNPQQMDLKALRRIPEERVSAVLGIPAIVAGLGAGLDRSTFANMSEAREMAYESNIIPTQRLLAAELQTQLLPDFDTRPNRVVRFDTSNVRVLQEDENKRWARYGTAYQQGLCMRSEARSALGLPTTPADDVYLTGLAQVFVGPGAPEPSMLESPPPDEQAPSEQATKGLERKGLTAAHKDRIGELFVKRLAGRERRFKRMMDGYFAEQGQRVVAALEAQEGAKALPDEIFDAPQETKQLRQLALPILRATVQEAAEEAVADYSLGISFDLSNPRVTKWIGERLTLFSRLVNETTKADITGILQRMEKEGASIADMKDAISGYYDGIGYRAERTARTEVVGASNKGALESYRQAGVERKEWLSALDERTREAHLEAHGQIVGIDEPFIVGGEELDGPGDGSPENAINCRCTILPVTD